MAEESDFLRRIRLSSSTVAAEAAPVESEKSDFLRRMELSAVKEQPKIPYEPTPMEQARISGANAIVPAAISGSKNLNPEKMEEMTKARSLDLGWPVEYALPIGVGLANPLAGSALFGGIQALKYGYPIVNTLAKTYENPDLTPEQRKALIINAETRNVPDLAINTALGFAPAAGIALKGAALSGGLKYPILKTMAKLGFKGELGQQLAGEAGVGLYGWAKQFMNPFKREALRRWKEEWKSSESAFEEELAYGAPSFSQYQKQVLDDVAKVALPKVEPFEEWTPPTWGYTNFYTKMMNKLASNLTEMVGEGKYLGQLTPYEGRPREMLNLLKQRFQVEQGTYNNIRDNFISKLALLPREEKVQVGRMINKYAPVTPKYRSFIQNLDTEIGALGKGLVDYYDDWLKQGWITKDEVKLLRTTWEENLGQYSHSTYLKPELEAKYPIVPSLAQTPGRIEQSIFKKKMTPEDWYIAKLMHDENLTEKSARAAMKKTAPEEIRKQGIAAKEAFGLVTPADVMTDITARKLSSNYAVASWMDAIARDPKMFSRTPQEGWVAVENLLGPIGVKRSPTLGPLNGGYIHPGLESDLRTLISTNKHPVENMFGETLAWFKIMKTAGSPGGMARNFVSGSFVQTDLAGCPIYDFRNTPVYFKAVKEYVTKGERWKYWNKQGLYGADYFNMEANLKDLAGVKDPIDVWAALYGKASKTKDLFKYYGAIDQVARTYMAEWSLAKGATPQQAIYYANKWQLDYRFVPKIVDMARKGTLGMAAPFLSFSYLMAPRIAEVAISRPLTLAKYPVMLEVANNYARSTWGWNREQEENARPRYMQGRSNWSLLYPKQFADKNGNPQWQDLSYTFPFTNNIYTGFVDVGQFHNVASGGGPVQITMNLNNNWDPFTEKPIWNDRTDTPDQIFTKQTAYVIQGMGPSVIKDIQRITAARNQDYYGYPFQFTRSELQAYLRPLGISIYSGGMNEYFGRINDVKKNIYEIQGQLGLEQKDVNLSATVKTRLLGERVGQIQTLINKLGELARNQPYILDTNPTAVPASEAQGGEESDFMRRIRMKEVK